MANVRKTKVITGKNTRLSYFHGWEPTSINGGPERYSVSVLIPKDDKETVKARINQAAKYIPLDRLCLSPQCGFASCEIGNKITEEQQWAKLALVKEIADEVWK